MVRSLASVNMTVTIPCGSRNFESYDQSYYQTGRAAMR
jgi:hypothetical protein